MDHPWVSDNVDRVLLKIVGLTGGGGGGAEKVADLWEHCSYVARSQSLPDIRVYEVIKGNSPGSKPKVLHRNMLLPFTGLPCLRTHTPEMEKKVQKRKDQEAVNRVEVQEP